MHTHIKFITHTKKHSQSYNNLSHILHKHHYPTNPKTSTNITSHQQNIHNPTYTNLPNPPNHNTTYNNLHITPNHNNNLNIHIYQITTYITKNQHTHINHHKNNFHKQHNNIIQIIHKDQVTYTT